MQNYIHEGKTCSIWVPQSSEWALCKYTYFSACHGFLTLWWWVCYKYIDRNRICSCMKRWILSNKYFAKTSAQLLTHLKSIVKLLQQWSAKSQTRGGRIHKYKGGNLWLNGRWRCTENWIVKLEKSDKWFPLGIILETSVSFSICSNDLCTEACC